MRIDVLTVFPEMFKNVLETSILGRAAEKKLLEFFLHDIRQYSKSKHHNTDDYPFGGGAGMVMMPQPVFDCYEAIAPLAGNARRIYLSPRGKTLTANLARELAQEDRLILLCGHYEGVDERVMTVFDEQISIGDYVLTGGELPAMVLIDCVSRFIPGVLGSKDSALDESFSFGLLEYPQYTRPAEFRGLKVPDVLLSGNHAEIEKWRRDQAIRITTEQRPDLISKMQSE